MSVTFRPELNAFSNVPWVSTKVVEPLNGKKVLQCARILRQSFLPWRVASPMVADIGRVFPCVLEQKPRACEVGVGRNPDVEALC